MVTITVTRTSDKCVRQPEAQNSVPEVPTKKIMLGFQNFNGFFPYDKNFKSNQKILQILLAPNIITLIKYTMSLIKY